jgi:hypothetical protein
MALKADWSARLCPFCGTYLRECCDSRFGGSHMTSCPKLGPFRDAPKGWLETLRDRLLGA